MFLLNSRFLFLKVIFKIKPNNLIKSNKFDFIVKYFIN